MFTQPILNGPLLIKTPGLGFDLQPNRLLLIASLPFLFLSSKRNEKHIHRPPFEKYIYIYLALAFVSLLINIDDIRRQALIAVPAEIVTFLVVYNVTKRHATPAFFSSVINAILWIAAISSIIALVQVSVASDFFRAGESRIAFGRVIRSTGVFREEYEMGYILILSIMIVLQIYKGSFWQKPFLGLLFAGLITTFHRLDLLIVFTCWLTYVWMTGNAQQKARSYGLLGMTAVIGTAFFLIFSEQIEQSDVVAKRLKEDTVTGRFRQYQVILEELPEFTLTGMGDYTNLRYYKLMEKHQMMRGYKKPGDPRWYSEPYMVHNGYLEVGLFYGAAAMIAFICLLFSMLFYFKKLIHSHIYCSAAPFYGVFIWILSNISNGISNFRIYFILLVSILIGSMISLHRHQISTPKNKE